MGQRKKIAILVGQADGHYQKQFIENFFRKAFQNDYDVCVFSTYKMKQDQNEYQIGESNIFNLIPYEMFDAIVFMVNTIWTVGVIERLEETIHARFKGPVIVVEGESQYFPTIWSDGYHSVRELVSHLIEVHGYSDIAFLSGKKWDLHTKSRVRAYREVMEQYGLKVREDRIFYADFDYQSGEDCAKQLYEHREDLPQAIICVHDNLTNGLCDALEKNGIRIPEDIAVVGVDIAADEKTCPEALTHVTMSAKQCGICAAEYLIACLAGEEMELKLIQADFVLGHSCGCEKRPVQVSDSSKVRYVKEQTGGGFFAADRFFPEEILKQKNFKDFVHTVYSNLSFLQDIESFHLCFTSYWENLNQHLLVDNPGTKYTEEMLYAIRYDRTKEENSRISFTDTFQTSELLPALEEEREQPAGYFFTPVFFESQCFGYAVLTYGSQAKGYDALYRMWIDAVCWGIECVRRIELIRALQSDEIRQKVTDKYGWYQDNVATVMTSLSMEEREELDEVEQILNENQLTYYFQPIVSAMDGEIYAYEALMRSRSKKNISPLCIIKYAGLLNRLVDVERATFLNVLGIIEQKQDLFDGKQVFINSIPGIKMDNRDLVRVEDKLYENPGVVVIELTEQKELEDDVLRDMKIVFDRWGIGLAVDDYGTGYSNVSNLLRYMPNYVKIDRILLSDIQKNTQKQHFVREIVEFCHDNEILALAEGVETVEELQIVIWLGVDLIQGYYTARPSAEIISSIDGKVKSEIKHFQQERQDGIAKNLYVAGKTSRVSLNSLVKGEYKNIVVGREDMTYKDITFVGTPGQEANIHIDIQSGYSGTITFENVHFSTTKQRPCIELDSECDVTLILKGDNTLQGGGIRVPENSKLTIEGDGNLSIILRSMENYGIGNDFSSRHGMLIFNQDGEINIDANGQKGIIIGSGLGGSIAIHKGKYVFHVNGEMYVGIGSYAGDETLIIHYNNIEIDMMVASGLGFGSVEGNADIDICHSAILYRVGGTEAVAFGSMYGKQATVRIHEANVKIHQNTQKSTCIGSLTGSTDFCMENAAVSISTSGKEALAFGGNNDNVRMNLHRSSVSVFVKSSLNRDTMAKDENIRMVNCTYQGSINGIKLERLGVDENFE